MFRKDIIKYQTDRNRPLILDGAVGSLLQMNTKKVHPILWSAILNFTEPEEIIRLHKDYISAGADIITTNTFRTNPVAYEKAELDTPYNDFVTMSVELAKIARNGNNNIFIAGSNPPAEDSYQSIRYLSHKQIESNHRKHIDLLWHSGCDFILNETLSHFDEIEIICQHCSDNNIPFILSFFITPELKILSGENIMETINFIKGFSPIAIGINCVYPKIFEIFRNNITIDYRWGFYLNCGIGTYGDLDIYEGVSPNNYTKIVRDSLLADPFFIGTCCGSNPAHTKSIKDYIDTKANS